MRARVIKDIPVSAAERAQVVTTLCLEASRLSRTPDVTVHPEPSGWRRGFRRRGDHRILAEMQPETSVITARPALASEVYARRHALDPRGELYSEDKRPRAGWPWRNLMQELRSEASCSAARPIPTDDRQLFANQL